MIFIVLCTFLAWFCAAAFRKSRDLLDLYFAVVLLEMAVFVAIGYWLLK